MRAGTVEGATTPHRLIEGMPGLYQEDDFSRRWLSAFDDVLAPVFLSLDGLPGYLDPAITPEDFLDWLAGWVGVLLDENWPIERRREFVARASELYRLRGTTSGLAEHVHIFTGGEVEVEDSGAVTWSKRTGGPIPGVAGYRITVRVRNAPGGIDRDRLEALVTTAKPAHCLHELDVAGSPSPAA